MTLQTQNAQPITVSIVLTVDALNHVINELSKPIEPIANLIADIRAQAVAQLEKLQPPAAPLTTAQQQDEPEVTVEKADA